MNEGENSFLGEEPVGKLMRKYAIPCIISLLVGALYNIVDQIFIANASYLGSYGNAANTVVFPLTVIALAIAVMIGDGCCAFVSLSLGKQEPDRARRSVGNSVVLMITSGILLMIIYLIFSNVIITMFGGTVNEETFRHSKEYFFYLPIYSDNDIETYRDVLFYVGQVLGGFFVINRAGELELRKYGNIPVLVVERKHRFSSSFSDFITRYTAVSSINLRTQIAEYYALDPDDGLIMNLGVNPLLQFGLEETRRQLCTNILNNLAVVNYVPFDLDTIGNPALDVGDILSFSGGQADATKYACITSNSIKIGGRQSIKCVGKIRSCPRRRVRMTKISPGFWLRSRQVRSGFIPSPTLRHLRWRMWIRRSFLSSLPPRWRTMRSSSGR